MSDQADIFPEINHELITPLQLLTDFELWDQWQKGPHKARYMLTIFFRYYQLSNIKEINLQQPELIEQYFDKIWIFIFDQLLVYPLLENASLQDTIKLLTEHFFSQEQIIVDPISQNQESFKEQIRYFPLQYFLEKALNKLLPVERIIILTTDKFGWEEKKILQYLEQQGQIIALSELQAYYTQAHSGLINALPTDIITIYLNSD